MTTPLIEAKNLSFTYPNSDTPAIRGINLEIEQGTSTLIVGKSGCGKSTLAMCLNGLIPHLFKGKFEGQLTIANMNTSTTQVWELASKVGLVFQNAESQLFTLAVEDEVAFGPENFGVSSDDIRERVGWALEAVNMGVCIQDSIFELSDGQKQRLALASTISCLPDIVVLDEPTANLDSEARQRFLQLLKNLKEQFGKTVVVIEHRLIGLKDYFDRVIGMENGEIKVDGSTRILLDTGAVEKLGLRQPIDKAGSSIDAACAAAFSSKAEYNEQRSKGEPIMSVRGLSFLYNGGFKLSDISLEIDKGEILGIIGRNGSGKTTLLKHLAGLLKPDSGEIKFRGKDIRTGQVQRPGKNIALVLQNPDHQLFMSTVYEEVAFSPASRSTIGLDREEHIETVLREMGLWDLRDRHPHSLSGGQKQRTTIAAALARDPEVLIVDEPTSGMDGYHLALLKTKLHNLRMSGVTIIIASHDEDLIDGLCNRVVILDKGRLVSNFS